MKSRKTILRSVILLSGLFLCQHFNSYGQQFWKQLPGETVPADGERTLVPYKYKTFYLNQEALLQFFNQLGTQPTDAATIELPMPTGKLETFKVWKTPVLPPNLQKKYPSIQTFTAVSVSNSYITAKLDYTYSGFHAMVFAPGNVWIIDPYSRTADGYYISFYQEDAPSFSATRIPCEYPEDNTGLSPAGQPVELHTSEQNGKTAERPSTNVKRTYRLALSCTGEYAQAVGGANPTKASVLSAMTTTLNRVNGIYEREIDVTMTLIPQEDTLIYLNPTTDPFTANNNGGQLLGQNQTNTNNLIGASNYDIGHIFSTGGGGIAQLASVCNSNVKARGVTGLANPIGDAFAVDYVAHEMGHQFGANHTFNDCSGNENWPTAYEPGSGSTIMAYAGICGPQNNLQLHSNDYFHAISLTEITNFLTSNWASCSTNENLSVTIPSFSSVQQNYSIPAGTPFELTAPQVTAGNDTDSLSYCWEQWDLGDLDSPEVTSATHLLGPIFRSDYPKINNPTRVFPDLKDLINNQLEQTPGERLPLVNRDLSFRLTARTIKNGWGSFQISDDSLHIAVVDAGNPFVVTYPNATGLTFQADSSISVTWNVAETQNSPVNCSAVDIYLSTDSGFTYPYTLATDVPNSGQAAVLLPNINTSNARIKVKAHGNIFFDISNNNFQIEGAHGTGIQNTIFDNNLEIAPNPASNEIRVRFTQPYPVQATLYNILGQKVWSGNFRERENIEVASLPRGIYLLKLTVPAINAQETKKIILQ